MKVYPKKNGNLQEFNENNRLLSTTEKISRHTALTIALVSVYYFFIKILFF